MVRDDVIWVKTGDASGVALHADQIGTAKLFVCEHLTGRLWVSYNQPVAFSLDGHLFVSVRFWSATTSKQLSRVKQGFHGFATTSQDACYRVAAQARAHQVAAGKAA